MSESAPQISIHVDYREKELYERLRGFIGDEGVVSTQNLAMGDVVIMRGGDKEMLYLERKTVADLSSSLSDGRYHEQKLRMTSNVERGRIVYIIEGRIPATPTHFMSEAKLTGIHSAVLHTTFRDGIVVYRTTDCNDTAVFVYQLWRRISKHPDEWDEYSGRKAVEAIPTDKSSTTALYMKRCDNNTPETAFANMLAQVNGCSVRIAEAITKKYATMDALVMAYHDQPCESRPQMLEDIVVEKRRIGKVLSRRIYEYLCVGSSSC